MEVRYGKEGLDTPRWSGLPTPFEHKITTRKPK